MPTRTHTESHAFLAQAAVFTAHAHILTFYISSLLYVLDVIAQQITLSDTTSSTIVPCTTRPPLQHHGPHIYTRRALFSGETGER